MEKNVIKSLFILVLGIFMLLPGTVNASWQAEWKYDVDLSNSRSASIAKLEDGIALMKYEGSASDGNVIIKLSNDGKVEKTIQNDYGYNMVEYDGGLLIYTPGSVVCELTKLDKDLNVLWSVSYNKYSPSHVVDLNEGFIALNGETLYVFDDDGNLIKEGSLRTYHNNLYDSNYWFYALACNKSLDGNNIVILTELVTNSWSSADATADIGVLVLSNELEVVSSYTADLDNYKEYIFNGVVETDDSFIFSGYKTVSFSKDGKIETQLDTTSYDASYLSKKVYAYTFNSNDVAYSYDTFISEYSSKLKLINKQKLPLSFNGLDFTDSTGFSTLKRRAVFYEDDGSPKVVILDTPIVTNSGPVNDPKHDGYNVTQYEINEEVEDTPQDDGIINTITRNPQTDSVVVIMAFVIVIIAVSSICYFLYKRKLVNKK